MSHLNLDIPLLNNILVPQSFRAIFSTTLHNISPSLLPLIEHPNSSVLDSLPSSAVTVSIPSDFWYNVSSISAILCRFTELEELEIGDNSLQTITEFHLRNMDRLRVIEIGKNSMTKSVNKGGYDASCSFQLVHCPSIEEISIGDYSFSDYASVEIRNCSNLVSIELGQMVFCYAVDTIMEGACLII